MLTALGATAMMVWGGAVEGATTCPSPAAVEALLSPESLLALRRQGHRVQLALEPGALKVRLLAPSGQPLLDRRLEASAPCASLAAASAAVVDAMELQLRSAASAVELPSFATQAASRPAQPSLVARDRPAAPRPARVGLELGALFLGSLSGGALVPAGALTLGLRLEPSGFRLRSGFFVEGQRSLAFASGSASYQRSWLSLGAGYELHWGRISLAFDLAALGSLLQLRGDGVTSLASESALEGGLSASLEARWSLGAYGLWAGAFALAWPAGTRVALAALNETRALPAWEGLLGAGVQFEAL